MLVETIIETMWKSKTPLLQEETVFLASEK